MAVSDPALRDWMSANFQMADGKPVLAGIHLEIIVGLVGAALVCWSANCWRAGKPPQPERRRKSAGNIFSAVSVC